MNLSVIICSHNPRSDYLQRALDALRAQTLPKQHWELLLVDNRSSDPLSERWDLSWHPNGTHIREEQLGLTFAFLAGIRESKGNVLVLVDDDNVLAPDYLMCALNKMNKYAQVGVWSGTIVPEFEKTPASWKSPFLSYLALNKEEVDRTSRDLESAPLPIGAGMVFRREVAQAFALWMAATAPRRNLALSRQGRTPRLYAGQEDTELGIVAIRNGFACGRTPDLQLTHLMPRRRITTRYLFRIARDHSYSHALIYRWHGLRRGQVSGREFVRDFLRYAAWAAFGVASGDAQRFGRGLVGISSLCGVGLAWRTGRY
jgi:glycosyltransferase involved in cell wall biosynthesis